MIKTTVWWCQGNIIKLHYQSTSHGDVIFKTREYYNKIFEKKNISYDNNDIRINIIFSNLITYNSHKMFWLQYKPKPIYELIKLVEIFSKTYLFILNLIKTYIKFILKLQKRNKMCLIYGKKTWVRQT